MEVELPIYSLPSLKLVRNFISEEEENMLLKEINAGEWSTVLSRRTQHYGFTYVYGSKAKLEYIGELPPWSEFLIDRLIECNLFTSRPNQIIINEYVSDPVPQGIAAHKDDRKLFGEEIASISLGSTTVMKFGKGDEKHEVFLERCSVIMFSDVARHEWTHEIPKRKTDVVNGVKYHRGTRVSITFRTVI